MFNKKTIKDIDVRSKTVLLRADYNVPIENGKITDDYRIEQSLPTIEYLIKKGARVVICSHLGRPDGRPDTSLSLWPVAKQLSKLLDAPVSFVDDCIGPKVEAAANKLKPGEVLLLENLRFHKAEEQNDNDFAAQLASIADIFVQDGFGVLHRAHDSTEAVTHHLPSVAGLLLAREVDTITRVMEAPERPLVAIIGGAKISDKIEMLNKFIEIADFVAVGGAMANTFLLAEGVDVAKSLVEPDDVPLAKAILEKAHKKAQKQQFGFYLPYDGVAAKTMNKTAKTRIVDWRWHTISSIEHYPKRPPREASRMHPEESLLDIGPSSAAFIAGSIQLAKTVIWNGTMGVAEVKGLQGPIGPFAHGTDVIVDAMLGQFGHKPFTLVGGGDTVAYVESQRLANAFDHISTGGGASLELMAGQTLPGVAALEGAKKVIQ